MCRTLFAVKIVGIGYTTSMAVKEIRVPSRGMRQTDVHMERCVMSKWIDADALIMALRLEYPMIPMFKENRKEWEIKTDGYRKAEEVVNDAPSIDIVRCAECKYEPICSHSVQHTTHEPTSVTIGYKSVDFCSYGERKESE